MGRSKVSIPKYSLHRPSGQAVVYIDRRMICLGKHGSSESHRKYGEIVAARSAGLSLPVDPAGQSAPSVSVNEICLRFATKKFPTYKTSTGEESAEAAAYRSAIRILRELFGETEAAKFGPVKLQNVRDKMLESGWTRGYINKQISRVRFIFRLAVSWELIPESVLASLKTLDALRRGDSVAPEGTPRQAVPIEEINAAKKRLRERNRDLIDLLLCTAARPGEILALTTQMIDRRGEVWSANLAVHKTSRHGHSRTLHFGARAQAILEKYLKPLAPSVRLFPIQRKTFGTAIRDACIKAGVPIFTPHWLRHTAVTMFADETDMESAQRVAGHSTAAMTILYTRAAQKKAAAAVKRLG